MSDTTPNLALPYIMVAQAQKHVTHNDAVRALDALVQMAAPQTSLVDGDRYITASSPSEVRRQVSYETNDSERTSYINYLKKFYMRRISFGPMPECRKALLKK